MTDSTPSEEQQTSLVITEATEEYKRARAESGDHPKDIVGDAKALGHFNDWCQDVRSDPLYDITNLTPNDLNQFKEWTAQSEGINTTDTLRVVREFVAWLEEEGYVDQDTHTVLEGE